MLRSIGLALLATTASLVAQQTQTVTVDVTPSHALNSFSPVRSLGAGVDGVPLGTVNRVYTPANVSEMLSAGWGPLTYRLYTELSVQDWHWNPTGSFSAGSVGYWTGSTASPTPIKNTRGFNLPRRGFTQDQGSNESYSRIDDGDPATFWKSNPYLSPLFTGQPDSAHPGWVMFDLGSKQPVNAVQINWAQPYATNYLIQYFTGSDPLYSANQGSWITFPSGTIAGGAGGTVTLQIASQPVSVEFIRIWMTASSNTCAAPHTTDPRDCVGFAINEAGVGTLSNGAFTDLVSHVPSQNQTLTYASSVDPWHTFADGDPSGEQPGLDLVFTSGITRGIPAVIPIAMLYGTPDDAANELAYVESKGYEVGYVEMGEEADGQFIVPEDYAELYIQFANALHAVDPKLKLGGPVLESDAQVYSWADASGNTIFLNRFINYLNAHGHSKDLAFMSYEHYPYVPCAFDWNGLLQEPAYTKMSLETWRADGLPADIPIFVTESNVSYDYQQQQVGLFGALWFSDFAGTFFSNGGSQVYYYEYEPLPLFSSSSCNSWGNFGMFVATPQNSIEEYSSQYFAAQLLTQQWAEPVDATHYVYPAASSILASNGAALVTAYALKRPDGQWSLMLINKDQNNSYNVTTAFQDFSTNRTGYFSGSVASAVLDPAVFLWRPMNALGYASPDGPLQQQTLSGGSGAVYTLPAASLTILRGNVN